VIPTETYQEIGIRSHGKGIFHKKSVTGADLGKKRVYWIAPNCLTLNIVFAWEQAVARTCGKDVGLIASHRFPLYEAKDELVELDYLVYFLKSPRGKHLLQLASPGGAGRNKTLGQQEFASIYVTLPPRAQQTEYAEALATWDHAITLTERLIAAKQRLRQGLMQQLLTGKRRFPGFSEPWRRCRIGDYLSESRVPGSHGAAANKITVRVRGKGVIARREIRRGSESTRYYIRYAGQFIYGKLDFLNGGFGIVPAHLDRFESTADLPCFDIGEGLLGAFLLEYVLREAFYRRNIAYAEGGRKGRRVHPAEFLSIKILIPTVEEQQAIVAVARTLDRELSLLRAQLAALKIQKKGLMQQLLTGKVRVKVAEKAA